MVLLFLYFYNRIIVYKICQIEGNSQASDIYLPQLGCPVIFQNTVEQILRYECYARCNKLMISEGSVSGYEQRSTAASDSEHTITTAHRSEMALVLVCLTFDCIVTLQFLILMLTMVIVSQLPVFTSSFVDRKYEQIIHCTHFHWDCLIFTNYFGGF